MTPSQCPRVDFRLRVHPSRRRVNHALLACGRGACTVAVGYPQLALTLAFRIQAPLAVAERSEEKKVLGSGSAAALSRESQHPLPLRTPGAHGKSSGKKNGVLCAIECNVAMPPLPVLVPALVPAQSCSPCRPRGHRRLPLRP